jgi:enolase
VETFHSLKRLLKARGLSIAGGDEGGFAPDLPSNESAIDVVLAAIEQAGFKPGQDIALALDIASSEFFSNGVYELVSEGKRFDSMQFADHLARWVSDYPIVSIEDGIPAESPRARRHRRVAGGSTQAGSSGPGMAAHPWH